MLIWPPAFEMMLLTLPVSSSGHGESEHRFPGEREASGSWNKGGEVVVIL